jgi:proteasome lid subunit RPN8/RPN11
MAKTKVLPTRVVIDRKVLHSFRRRALQHFPQEHIEGMWGRQTVSSYQIHAICELTKICATGSRVEYDPVDCDEGSCGGLEYLGSIHTHPNSPCEPSPEDWKDFNQCEPEAEPERIMAILGISIRNKRRYTSVGFWNHLRHLEVQTVD